MVKEETHGNIYPNTHILDILASWKSYKEVVVTDTHWKFRVDSKYFRGEKAIQSLGHLTKIRLCHSVPAPWMSVLAQTQPRNAGCLWKPRARQSSLSGQKGMRILLPVHFTLLDAGQERLSPVLEAHEEPNTSSLHRSFTRLQHQLFCEYQRCCLRVGILCDTGTPMCQRHTGTPNTPGRCPSAAAEHWDNAASRQGHSSHRTSLTKTRVHLWATRWVKSPSTPTKIPAALCEVAGSGPCPQQRAG